MVANENGVTIAAADQSKASGAIKEELPSGNYIPVGVDIDTTGRRLIDEIVQLAAYTPHEHFEQYIMPYMNLNPAARQRHQVRVISIGFYRMLKSMQTYKIIKSKSEIAALRDFLDWLEQINSKKANSNGIILLYHEERKFIPYMILESLKKYGLLDRFSKTVKSFANCLSLAKARMSDAKHYNLRKLTKILSTTNEDNKRASSEGATDSGTNIKDRRIRNALQYERDDFDGNASVRAKLTFNLALQLSNSDQNIEPNSSDAIVNVLNALKPFLEPISADVKELDIQNANLERQNSFRPVFLNYFKTTLYHRVRAVKFRIVLAESGFDLPTLNVIWSERGSDGLGAALQPVTGLKTEDKMELVELLDSYFDPNKAIIKPIAHNNNNNRRRNRRGNLSQQKPTSSNSSRSVNTEFGAGGDKSQSVSSVPDSTTKTPPSAINAKNGNGMGNGGRPQRKRNSRHSLNTSGIKTELSVLNTSAPAAVSMPSTPVTTKVAIVASN